MGVTSKDDPVTFLLPLGQYKGYDEIKNKREAKRRIAEVIIDGMQEHLQRAVSPVSGGAYKRTLSPGYAKKKGRNIADLLLEGDLQNSFDAKQREGGIEVGVFRSKERPKAFNHQTGDTLPRRQFLPEVDQKFKPAIERKIKAVIKEMHGER